MPHSASGINEVPSDDPKLMYQYHEMMQSKSKKTLNTRVCKEKIDHNI